MYVGRLMNINLWDSIVWWAEQTCWWTNHTSQPALSVCPVLIDQTLESWTLIGGMTITGQTSISLSGESSGLTLMMAVSPVLVWLCLFLIMGCLLITYFSFLEFFNFFICLKELHFNVESWNIWKTLFNNVKLF